MCPPRKSHAARLVPWAWMVKAHATSILSFMRRLVVPQDRLAYVRADTEVALTATPQATVFIKVRAAEGRFITPLPWLATLLVWAHGPRTTSAGVQRRRQARHLPHQARGGGRAFRHPSHPRGGAQVTVGKHQAFHISCTGRRRGRFQVLHLINTHTSLPSQARDGPSGAPVPRAEPLPLPAGPRHCGGTGSQNIAARGGQRQRPPFVPWPGGRAPICGRAARWRGAAHQPGAVPRDLRHRQRR